MSAIIFSYVFFLSSSFYFFFFFILFGWGLVFLFFALGRNSLNIQLYPKCYKSCYYKVVLKDALSIHSWVCCFTAKNVPCRFDLWCLRDLVRLSQSLINWYHRQETQRNKIWCIHKYSIFWWHETEVRMWIAPLPEPKLSIQNPYLGRIYIAFRRYFFPEKVRVKKFRIRFLCPAAMLLLLLRRLPAPVNMDFCW